MPSVIFFVLVFVDAMASLVYGIMAQTGRTFVDFPFMSFSGCFSRFHFRFPTKASCFSPVGFSVSQKRVFTSYSLIVPPENQSIMLFLKS